MKQNWSAIILFLILLLSVSGLLWVYWYKYRPEEIGALCQEEAKVNKLRPRPADDPFKRRVRTYQECLQENGINK